MTTKSIINWAPSDQPDLDYSNVSRYIDLAVGNFGQFINVPLHIPCLINDSNSEVIAFYKSLKDPGFIEEIKQFSKSWKLLESFSLEAVNELFMSFLDYSDGIITKNDLTYMVRAIVLMHLDNPKFDIFVRNEYVVSFDMFTNSLVKSLVQELVRLKTKVNHENFNSTVSDDFIRGIETAYRIGIYTHFQNLYNWKNTDLINCVSNQKLVVIWYFLNQLSQGQSVQYDKNGNIKSPYAGETMNFFDFDKEISVIETSIIQKRLENTSFFNLDPDQFLATMPLFENDLVVFHFSDSTLSNHKAIQGKLLKAINLIDSLPSKWVIISQYELAQCISSMISIPFTTIENKPKQLIILKNY